MHLFALCIHNYQLCEVPSSVFVCSIPSEYYLHKVLCSIDRLCSVNLSPDSPPCMHLESIFKCFFLSDCDSAVCVCLLCWMLFLLQLQTESINQDLCQSTPCKLGVVLCPQLHGLFIGGPSSQPVLLEPCPPLISLQALFDSIVAVQAPENGTIKTETKVEVSLRRLRQRKNQNQSPASAGCRTPHNPRLNIVGTRVAIWWEEDKRHYRVRKFSSIIISTLV